MVDKTTVATLVASREILKATSFSHGESLTILPGSGLAAGFVSSVRMDLASNLNLD